MAWLWHGRIGQFHIKILIIQHCGGISDTDFPPGQLFQLFLQDFYFIPDVFFRSHFMALFAGPKIAGGVVQFGVFWPVFSLPGAGVPVHGLLFQPETPRSAAIWR